MAKKELTTSLEEKLETHDVVDVRKDGPFELLTVELKLKANEKGGAMNEFGGNPKTESYNFLSKEDMKAVKESIDADSKQGKKWLEIIADYEERIPESDGVKIKPSTKSAPGRQQSTRLPSPWDNF